MNPIPEQKNIRTDEKKISFPVFMEKIIHDGKIDLVEGKELIARYDTERKNISAETQKAVAELKKRIDALTSSRGNPVVLDRENIADVATMADLSIDGLTATVEGFDQQIRENKLERERKKNEEKRIQEDPKGGFTGRVNSFFTMMNGFFDDTDTSQKK